MAYGHVSAQIKLKTYTSATDTFYWKKYEHVPPPARLNLKKYTVANNASQVETFLQNTPQAFKTFISDSLRMHPENPPKKYLYAININHDALPDIVFNGSGRNETEMVQIYINRKDSFDLVFEDYRYISELSGDKAGITGVVTGDPGKKGDYRYFRRYYSIAHEGKSVAFIRGKQTVEYKFTQRPGKEFENPRPFKAMNDTTLVRASARFIDAPYDPKLKTWGNIICGFTKVISGNILAMEKDAAGLIWYFVEIFPDEKPEKSIFGDLGNYPTFIHGWLPSEDISAGK